MLVMAGTALLSRASLTIDLPKPRPCLVWSIATGRGFLREPDVGSAPCRCLDACRRVPPLPLRGCRRRLPLILCRRFRFGRCLPSGSPARNASANDRAVPSRASGSTSSFSLTDRLLFPRLLQHALLGEQPGQVRLVGDRRLRISWKCRHSCSST